MLPPSRHWPVLLFLLLLPAAIWCQQTAPVTLQVAPNNVSMAAGERRQVLVIATVNGSSAVRKLKLRVRPEPGTHAFIGRIPQLPDQVRGDVSWPVSISKDADGKTSAHLIFEALYESGDANAPVPGVAQAGLDLTVKQRPTNDQVATATIQTSFDKLEERRPQDVYLVVTNLSDVPLQITGVVGSLPSFVNVSVDGQSLKPAQGVTTIYSSVGQTSPLILPPRQDHIFHMVLQIPDYTAVLTGKYLMLFDVKLHYMKDGYTTDSSVLANKDFQAGVLGEQEFVGITSVPFLLLPGFLVVAILAFLWSKFWPKRSIEFDWKKPESYLAGVIVSIVMVFLYKPLSPWLFTVLWRTHLPARDLLAGFSLEDIINIYVLSIAVAVVPWMVVGGGARLFAAAQARRQKDRTPTPQDQPLDILQRLQRAGKGFNLQQATVGNQRLWELPLPSPDPAKKWVSSKIRVQFPNDNDVPPARRDAVNQAQHDFLDILNQQPDDGARTQRLCTTLLAVRDEVQLSWDPNHPPELVDKKDNPTMTTTPAEFVIAAA